MPAWPMPLAAALLATLAVAGCLGSPAATPPQQVAPSSAAPAGAPFSMNGEGCVEAGFVAAYNMNDGAPTDLAGGAWKTADIREEIGNPMHDAVGRPTNGPMYGNWHMGFRCAKVASDAGEASDFLFGYVGAMVEPPAWDPGGADLHFLMSGFGFGEGPLGEAFRATTSAAITPAAEARIDWYLPKELPRSAAYVVYVDGEKGVYESWGDLMLLREAPERTIRLWWQVRTDGEKDDHHHHNAMNDLTFNRLDEDGTGEYHPLYWDVKVSAAPQYVTPPMDGVQFASHNMLNMEHGAVLTQPTTTTIYEYAALTFTSGRVVEDVVLERMWNH